MRNWIIAAVIALSAPLVAGATSASADTRVIIRDTGHDRPHQARRYHHRPDRVVERRHVRMHRDRDCATRKVVRIVHGERIVKTTRVCR